MLGSFLKEASEWVSSALNEVEQVLSAPVDDPGRVTTLVARTMYLFHKVLGLEPKVMSVSCFLEATDTAKYVY